MGVASAYSPGAYTFHTQVEACKLTWRCCSDAAQVVYRVTTLENQLNYLVEPNLSAVESLGSDSWIEIASMMQKRIASRIGL